jgi:hypothetical protein
MLKKKEKLDNGTSNSSILFFGTTGSALGVGVAKNRWEGKNREED